MRRLRPALLVLLVLLAGCRGRRERRAFERLEYPPARTVDHVDVYHGVAVRDPYRWLEDMDSPETRAWIEAQNRITFDSIRRGRAYRRIRRRLEELWTFEQYGLPEQSGGRYFYRRNDGTQNQAVLYVADALEAEPRVLIDPNTLSEDGTVALRRIYPSPDGRLLAYGLSNGGSDWQTFYVRDVETGEDLAADRLEQIKFSGAAWDAEGRGFFYARTPATAEGAELVEANRPPQVFYHRVGTPQSEDRLVYERPDQPGWFLYPFLTDDFRYLLVAASRGSSAQNAVFWRDLKEEGGGFRPLFDAFDAKYWIVGNDGAVFYVFTDKDAPKGRIVAVDARDPKPESWRTVVPEGKLAIDSVTMVGDRLLVSALRHATTQVRIFGIDGGLERELTLPGLGTAAGFRGRRADRETFYVFTSFLSPPAIYRYDFTTGESTLFRRAQVDFDAEDYEAHQVFYLAKDGTRIPMFLVHGKGLERDGDRPTLLTGYGGFGNSLTPWFSVSNAVWLEMGGVLAVANLRGGGEYGEAWHRAGMLEKKQTVFDDFIAAAEGLIYNGYTRPARLGIAGGSNGGLLVAACMNQRPDLFGACLPAVGVMDMLRYHRFTVGRHWISEYGSADDPKMFPVLLKYSPYHNIRKGVHYPATLITTGDHDDRVVPLHSYKYAARLQAAQGGPAPILLRVETSAGHGAGMPRAKRIDLAADRWAFLARVLMMHVRRLG